MGRCVVSPAAGLGRGQSRPEADRDQRDRAPRAPGQPPVPHLAAEQQGQRQFDDEDRLDERDRAGGQRRRLQQRRHQDHGDAGQPDRGAGPDRRSVTAPTAATFGPAKRRGAATRTRWRCWPPSGEPARRKSRQCPYPRNVKRYQSPILPNSDSGRYGSPADRRRPEPGLSRPGGAARPARRLSPSGGGSPSLPKMLATCFSTAPPEITSAAETPALERPSAMRASTSRSRRVSVASPSACRRLTVRAPARGAGPGRTP